jgi:hypothetical protein
MKSKKNNTGERKVLLLFQQLQKSRESIEIFFGLGFIGPNSQK